MQSTCCLGIVGNTLSKHVCTTLEHSSTRHYISIPSIKKQPNSKLEQKRPLRSRPLPYKDKTKDKKNARNATKAIGVAYRHHVFCRLLCRALMAHSLLYLRTVYTHRVEPPQLTSSHITAMTTTTTLDRPPQNFPHYNSTSPFDNVSHTPTTTQPPEKPTDARCDGSKTIAKPRAQPNNNNKHNPHTLFHIIDMTVSIATFAIQLQHQHCWK